MTIWKKNAFEKEVYDALQVSMDGAYYGVQVQKYSEDGCMATIDVKVSMIINGAISDLPSSYEAKEDADFYPRGAKKSGNAKRRRKID